MTHEEIKILISAYIDGEVTPSEKTIVEEHLSTCPDCQKDYKKYMAMSSSLSKWSDETLSPDEEIKVQKRFEQRREPMFTKRSLMTLGTTLAITLIIGSVVQMQLKKVQFQGRLKSAADDMGDQYSDSNTNRLQDFYSDAGSRFRSGSEASTYTAQPSMRMAQGTQYEPYYMQSDYRVTDEDKVSRLRRNLVGADQLMAMATPARASIAGGLSGNPAASYQVFPVYAKASAVYAGASSNNEHKVIKNADITLKVENAQKAQDQLDGLVTKFNGIVVNFQINKSEDGSRSGLLVFNVLPKDLKSVLGAIRKLGEVQSENQSGVDVTDQYGYLQARLENYQTVKDRLQKILLKNANNVDNNLNIESEITSVDANMDAIENSIKLLDDQSYMATVVVNFYDTVNKTIVKEIGFKDKFVTTLKNNLKSTLQTSYEIGINSFSGIFIVLSFFIQVLIWSLIFWGVYLVVNKFMKK